MLFTYVIMMVQQHNILLKVCTDYMIKTPGMVDSTINKIF